MTKLVCDHTVRVVRDKQNVTVPAGQAFAFTEKEQKDILKSRPHSLRDPRNESDDVSPEAKKRDADAQAEVIQLRQQADEAAAREKRLSEENARLKAQAASAAQAAANTQGQTAAKTGAKGAAKTDTKGAAKADTQGAAETGTKGNEDGEL